MVSAVFYQFYAPITNTAPNVFFEGFFFCFSFEKKNTLSNYDFGFGCMAAAVDDFVVVVVAADNWITD